jgi:peroxiredoxin
LPAIEKLHKAYKDKGLVVLGIDYKEDIKVVQEFYKKNAMTFPTAVDSKGDVYDHYGITGIPTTVIYDRKGRIVTQFVESRSEQQFLNLLRKAGLR